MRHCSVHAHSIIYCQTFESANTHNLNSHVAALCAHPAQFTDH